MKITPSPTDPICICVPKNMIGGESRKKRKQQVSECEAKEEEKITGKKPRTPAATTVENDLEGGEDMLAWLTLDEETVMELSRLLEPTLETASELEWNFKVKFIDNPYISPVIVQSSSAYVTINGNEESCGSSFSESESSVMASIDRCCGWTWSGGGGAVAAAECSVGEFSGGGAWGSDAAEAFGGLMEEGNGDAEAEAEGLIDGCDWLGITEGYDIDVSDDDMWEKFLGNDLFGTW